MSIDLFATCQWNCRCFLPSNQPTHPTRIPCHLTRLSHLLDSSWIHSRIPQVPWPSPPRQGPRFWRFHWRIFDTKIRWKYYSMPESSIYCKSIPDRTKIHSQIISSDSVQLFRRYCDIQPYWHCFFVSTTFLSILMLTQFQLLDVTLCRLAENGSWWYKFHSAWRSNCWFGSFHDWTTWKTDPTRTCIETYLELCWFLHRTTATSKHIHHSDWCEFWCHSILMIQSLLLIFYLISSYLLLRFSIDVLSVFELGKNYTKCIQKLNELTWRYEYRRWLEYSTFPLPSFYLPYLFDTYLICLILTLFDWYISDWWKFSLSEPSRWGEHAHSHPFEAVHRDQVFCL